MRDCEKRRECMWSVNIVNSSVKLGKSEVDVAVAKTKREIAGMKIAQILALLRPSVAIVVWLFFSERTMTRTMVVHT